MGIKDIGVYEKMTEELQYRSDIENAPKDGTPILAYCHHNSDPYYEKDGRHITVYASHCEGCDHVDDGPNVVVFGGSYSDYDEFGDCHIFIPDYWFLYGSNFEIVANPVLWYPLPKVILGHLGLYNAHL